MAAWRRTTFREDYGAARAAADALMRSSKTRQESQDSEADSNAAVSFGEHVSDPEFCKVMQKYFQLAGLNLTNYIQRTTLAPRCFCIITSATST